MDTLKKAQLRVEADRELERERFHQSIQSILNANPNSLCTFQLNLTKNLCYEGHGASVYILRTLQSDTAEGLFANTAAIIPHDDDRIHFSTIFSRENLIADFGAGKSSQYLDYRRSSGDGRLVWVRTSIALLRNPETEDIEGALYSLDISREKQRDKILSIITSQEYDLIGLLHLNTGIFEAVYLGDTLPAQYREMLPEPGSCCAFSDITARAAAQWIDEEDRARYVHNGSIEYCRKTLAGGGQYEFIARAHFPDCSSGTMYRKFQHYAFDDDDSTVLVAESDVSALYMQQRRELETEKRLRREAIAANSAKTDFLSRMSHDIRTPLNGIIGMTYLAGEEDNPPATRDYLSKIDTSSRFLLGLVNDILDMSKAESGRMELHPEPYLSDDFSAYIDAVIRPLCNSKSQTLVFETGRIGDIVPLMDILRINQIYFNLLSNAVKFTPEGGTIKVKVHEELVPQNKDRITVTISDSGIGMSEDFQKVLFEPFTQEGRAGKNQVQGSGLGLAIVKKTIEAMGGTISVKSQIGKGSTFAFINDYDFVHEKDLAKKTEQENAVISEAVLEGKHVLLCEDHPLNQEIAKAILGEKGIKIEIAENGQRGVDLFAESPVGFYDAVLMDIRMPVMDGYEATKAIRRLPREDAARVPIIAMTADAFSDDMKKCIEVGMAGHIAKPFEPAKLFETLAGCIQARDR